MLMRFCSPLSRLSSVLVAAAVGLSLWLPPAARAEAGQALACLQLVERLATDGRVPLQGVHFEFNRATLGPDSLPALVAARDAILTLGGTWTFEGHTDAIGSRDYNQSLSEARALAVRDWMVAAGVDAGQLSHAGFSFDRPLADNATEAGRALNRRVEMVGIVTPDMPGLGGPDGIDRCPDTLTPGRHDGAAQDVPAITDWTGAGGQAWLPFSYLMATGDGVEGWGGETVVMPRGSQPQACQALCAAEALCAGFSFQPSGSFNVEDVRCMLTGYGGERFINRANGHYEGGTFFVTGFKPDARVLTPESEAVAAGILADMAEIAALRARVRLTAPFEVATESWLEVALDGHVPGDSYASFVEIADLDDFDFSWWKSRGAIFVHDMEDGRSGRIRTPEPGDYVLRYGIEHPTAGTHVIAAQALRVGGGPVGGAADPGGLRAGTVEPGVDRPGQDIAQTPLAVADPLACQALCAGDAECRAWTYVNPGLQGDLAVCWTKSGVPEGFDNPCCTSGVMDQAAVRDDSEGAVARLEVPGTVAPGAVFAVGYAGPLHAGDWIDIISPGNDDDMSGGRGWAWADGGPVALTAPEAPGAYVLRYVAEDPERGRVVLAETALVVAAGTVAAAAVVPGEVVLACGAEVQGPCTFEDGETGLTFRLPPGYGISAPYFHETPGGARAERASVDLWRLATGEVVAWINLRQATLPTCFDEGPDHVCLGVMPDAADGMALMMVLGALSGGFSESEAPAPDPAAGEDDFAGAWEIRRFEDGHPRDGLAMVAVDLRGVVAGGPVEGPFRTAVDFDLLPGVSGLARLGFVADGRMEVELLAEDGARLVMLATAFGPWDWTGELSGPGGVVVGAAFSRVAGEEDGWDFPDWTRPEEDGMAAALRMGQQMMEELLGDMSPEDRAVFETLGEMLGVPGGDGALGGMVPADAAEMMMQALEGVLAGE